MTTDTWVTIAGSLGGFCTTFAFVPQVLKIWKQGGRDLSYGMLAIYLFGVILWLVYGILLHAQAVIITNVATAILIAIATMLKAWTAKRDVVKNTILSASRARIKSGSFVPAINFFTNFPTLCLVSRIAPVL